MKLALQAIWTALQQTLLALIGQPVAGNKLKPKRAPDFALLHPAAPCGKCHGKLGWP